MSEFLHHEMKTMSSKSDDNPPAVKLPYFHRPQTQEEKDLIGDITPKHISIDNTSSSGSRSIVKSASWNTADTWEERDCSEWSRLKMQDIFGDVFEVQNAEYRIVLSSLGEFADRSHELSLVML